MSNLKDRYHLADVLPVAQYLRDRLSPACLRLELVGSARRHRGDVGDVELLFISKPAECDLLGEATGPSPADSAIAALERDGCLARRRNGAGRISSWGEVNKHALYMQGAACGMPAPPLTIDGQERPLPVDLFTATEANWISLLVCRTGPADLNVRICQRAQERGMHWQPYEGFRQHGTKGSVLHPASEQDFFEILGWNYLPPARRHELCQ